MFKKTISSIIVASLVATLIPVTSAASISTDFSVKISSAGDETYATSLANVSYYNTDITLQFTEVSSGGYEEYSADLPAGFVYQSSNTVGSTCAGLSVSNASNSNFHFSFSGTTALCTAKAEFVYRITTLAPIGSQTVNLLTKIGPSSWGIATSVLLDIVPNNMITRAVSEDMNGNGYIDSYLLSFATGGVVASSLSGITVAGASMLGTTQTGSNWLVNFTDNVWNTGNLPQIGGIFDGITLLTSSVNETDGAKPQIININGTNPLTLTGGQSIFIGTGAFDSIFSERMTPSSVNTFALKLGIATIPGIFSFNTNLDTLTFAPSSSLVAGTYTLSSATGATDWSGNDNTFSGTLRTSHCIATTQTVGTHSYSVPRLGNSTTTTVTSAAVGIAGGSVTYTQSFACSLGSVSTSGSETINTPSCNPGYTVNGSICVANPSSGWGGGSWSLSSDYCPIGDFSGNLYDGKCTAPIPTSTGSLTSTGTTTGSGIIIESNWGPVADWIPPLSNPDSLSVGSFDTHYFTGIIAARNYLGTKITDIRILRLADQYRDKLILMDEVYFPSIDRDLYLQYNRIVNAYVVLFLRVNDIVGGNRSESVRNDGKQSYYVIANGVTLAMNLLDRYITRTYFVNQDIIVYRTKSALLTKPLSVLEGKVLSKFDSLLASGTIDMDEYKKSVQAYNDFVLHLSIYRGYSRNALVKAYAIDAIKIFTATYAK